MLSVCQPGQETIVNIFNLPSRWLGMTARGAIVTSYKLRQQRNFQNKQWPNEDERAERSRAKQSRAEQSREEQCCVRVGSRLRIAHDEPSIISPSHDYCGPDGQDIHVGGFAPRSVSESALRSSQFTPVASISFNQSPNHRLKDNLIVLTMAARTSPE